MKIKKFRLIQVRNFENIEIETDKNITIFTGKNGAGKTNLLESVNLASFGKSFRTNKDEELIKFNKNECTTKTQIIHSTNRNIILMSNWHLSLRV